MFLTQKTVTYQRRQEEGTLTLRGCVDIFEAGALHAAVQRALRDSKASAICVNLAEVERLDVSAIQLLLALRREVEAAGRIFLLRECASTKTQPFALLGVALHP